MFESFIGVNFWTALAVLINTLLIFFVGKIYLFVPVKKMIDSRQQEIDAMYAQADDAKEQAQAMQKEYEQKLSAAAAASEQIVKDAVARGQSREEQILRQANAEADAIRAKASADIAQERKKALNDAKNEISDIAVSIASKVVEKEIREEDHQKLIQDFIDQMGEAV